MRTVRAALAVTLVTAGLVVGTAAGAQAAGPRVTADPYYGLVNGTSVTLHGTGLPANITVNVVECGEPTDPGAGTGCPVLTTATTGTTGKAVASVNAVDPVWLEGASPNGNPTYCRADVCHFYMEWTDRSGFHSVGTNALHFVGSPATITVTPTSGLADGQTVHVSGTAHGSTGRYVEITESTCYNIIQGAGCQGTLTLATLALNSHQNFTGNVTAFRYLADGGDCTTNEFGCQIGVTVLNNNGVPDDSFGVSSWGQPGVAITFAG